MAFIHALIASIAAHKWPLYQMNARNTILNSDLFEMVCMQPLLGVDSPTRHVCRLRRAFYGLKQAPHAWFEWFRRSLLPIFIVS